MDGSNWAVNFRESTRFWVQYVLVPIVVVVGVLGNCATIRILTTKKMRNSSNIYLTALAVSDLLFLVFLCSMSWRHFDFMKSVRSYWSYIPVGLWFTDASSSTSVWLTVSFTIERYLAVCHPMMLKSPLTEQRAIFVCSCVYIACFLLTASTPFEWKGVQVTPNDLNVVNLSSEANVTEMFDLVNTELGRNSWYRFAFHWFTTIMFVIVPWIILAIGNTCLIKSIRKAIKERSSLTHRHFANNQLRTMRQEHRITVTLIAVVMVFLICQMPTAIVLVYTALHTPAKGSSQENVLLGLGNIFNLLVAINAACNFILYTALSHNYKRVFIEIFCCGSLMPYMGRRVNQTQRVFTLQKFANVRNRFGHYNSSLEANHGSNTHSRSEISFVERVFCSSGTFHIYEGYWIIQQHVVSKLVLRKDLRQTSFCNHREADCRHPGSRELNSV